MEGKVWANKSLFILATSPGARGGATVLNQAVTTFPYQGAQVAASFSLPSFYQSFSNEERIKDEALKTTFEEQLKAFTASLPN